MEYKYKSWNVEQALGHVVEECGEVLAAAGKIQRFGWAGVNPELPALRQETNKAWLRRELQDLKRAIVVLEDFTSRIGGESKMPTQPLEPQRIDKSDNLEGK